MTSGVYTPRPGSVAQRAIAHLETLAPHEEISTGALAEAITVTPGGIAHGLDEAVQAGLVRRHQRGGHVRSPMFWALARAGGNKDAKAPDAGHQPASEAAQARHDDRPGPGAASTPTNGRPLACNGHDPEGAAAMAGRPATTAQETTHRDAGRARNEQLREDTGAGDGAKPDVGVAAPEGLRIALWSDGELHIERDTGGAVRCEELRPDVPWRVLREQVA